MIIEKDLLTIKEASKWASDYLRENVTTSNISYLIQYGRIKKIGTNGAVQIDKRDLIKYYESYVVSGRKLINTRKIKGAEQVGK